MTREFSNSPLLFLEMGNSKPYQKQIDIAMVVASTRRVSVVGCNGSGKDWLAARLALWYVLSKAATNAKVLITAPTFRQVDDIVFNEIRSAYRNFPYHIGGRMFDSPRWEYSPDTFIVGFSTDRAWNLQGYHSQNLLVIVTEAHAMDEDSMNALYTLNPTKMLMVGNAFTSNGSFYKSHHQDRGLWNAFQISAYDTPNFKGEGVVLGGMITPEDAEEKARIWGEESPMYKGSVLGQFSDSLDNVGFPFSPAILHVINGLFSE